MRQGEVWSSVALVGQRGMRGIRGEAYIQLQCLQLKPVLRCPSGTCALVSRCASRDGCRLGSAAHLWPTRAGTPPQGGGRRGSAAASCPVASGCARTPGTACAGRPQTPPPPAGAQGQAWREAKWQLVT